eukprot:7007902-Prymnesium_polylepis.1
MARHRRAHACDVDHVVTRDDASQNKLGVNGGPQEGSSGQQQDFLLRQRRFRRGRYGRWPMLSPEA